MATKRDGDHGEVLSVLAELRRVFPEEIHVSSISWEGEAGAPGTITIAAQVSSKALTDVIAVTTWRPKQTAENPHYQFATGASPTPTPLTITELQHHNEPVTELLARWSRAIQVGAVVEQVKAEAWENIRKATLGLTVSLPKLTDGEETP